MHGAGRVNSSGKSKEDKATQKFRRNYDLPNSHD